MPNAIVAATDDPAAAWGAVASYLLADPVAHNQLATLLHGMQAGGTEQGARTWWVEERGAVRGLAVRPAGAGGLVLAVDGPETAGALASGLADEGLELGGTEGEAAAAFAFASAWAERRRVAIRIEGSKVLRVLDTLTPPPAAPGRLRAGEWGDLELLVTWSAAFDDETVPYRPGDPTHTARNMADRIASQRVWLWEAPVGAVTTGRGALDGGRSAVEPGPGPAERHEPVAMLGATATVSGVSRIQGVYTPPEHRGYGYAAAATAAVTAQRLSVAGATRCVLFADLANPTSNGIYRRLGFHPYRQHVDLLFDPA